MFASFAVVVLLLCAVLTVDAFQFRIPMGNNRWNTRNFLQAVEDEVVTSNEQQVQFDGSTATPVVSTDTVYVSNLSFNLEDEQIVAAIKEKLLNKQILIKDLKIPRNKGRSRGVAYVQVEDPNTLTSAIESLSTLALDGREVRASQKLIKPRSETGENDNETNTRSNSSNFRERRTNNFSGSSSSSSSSTSNAFRKTRDLSPEELNERSIFIGNIPKRYSKDEFMSFLQDQLDMNQVKNVRYATNQDGKSYYDSYLFS
jgi:RNA recognition motif-containing protein